LISDGVQLQDSLISQSRKRLEYIRGFTAMYSSVRSVSELNTRVNLELKQKVSSLHQEILNSWGSCFQSERRKIESNLTLDQLDLIYEEKKENQILKQVPLPGFQPWIPRIFIHYRMKLTLSIGFLPYSLLFIYFFVDPLVYWIFFLVFLVFIGVGFLALRNAENKYDILESEKKFVNYYVDSMIENLNCHYEKYAPLCAGAYIEYLASFSTAKKVNHD